MTMLEDKTHEELVAQVRRLQDSCGLHAGAIAGIRDAYVKKLSDLRSAKAKANQRADVAEKGLRALVEAFGENVTASPPEAAKADIHAKAGQFASLEKQLAEAKRILESNARIFCNYALNHEAKLRNSVLTSEKERDTRLKAQQNTEHATMIRDWLEANR